MFLNQIINEIHSREKWLVWYCIRVWLSLLLREFLPARQEHYKYIELLAKIVIRSRIDELLIGYCDGRKNALHTVSAWSCQHLLVLALVAVDNKTNEIKAILKLLTLLEIENSIITLDAKGCQREIAVQLVKQKSDHIFTL